MSYRIVKTTEELRGRIAPETIVLRANVKNRHIAYRIIDNDRARHMLNYVVEEDDDCVVVEFPPKMRAIYRIEEEAD